MGNQFIKDVIGKSSTWQLPSNFCRQNFHSVIFYLLKNHIL